MIKINIFPLILILAAPFTMILVSGIEMFFTLLIPITIGIAFYCYNQYKFFIINSQNGIYINDSMMQMAISLTFYGIYFFGLSVGIMLLGAGIAELFQISDIWSNRLFYMGSMLISLLIYFPIVHILNKIASKNIPIKSNSDQKGDDFV